jgi:phosphoglycolate phosphatase
LRQETIDHRISGYFDYIDGLDDHYAHGKTDVGIRLLKELDVERRKILFIGDTCHDAEVANELGIDCILVPNGHHSAERLRKTCWPIVQNLDKLSGYLCNLIG